MANESQPIKRDDAKKLYIMTQVVKALVHYGCPEDQAAATVRLIALGKIPNLVIEY